MERALRVKKKRGYRAVLIIVGIWAAVSAYFACLHTFTVKTCYLDETVTLDNQQYIVQEIEAVNFERDFLASYDIWYMNVLYKLPAALQRPFYYMVSFYSQPGITYKDTWEVKIKGVAIPQLPEEAYETVDMYIDGHLRGLGYQHSDNEDYTLFNIHGDYFSPEDVDKLISLVFEDKNTGSDSVIYLEPQWKKQYYFMRLPSDSADDPAKTARQFMTLASQSQKSAAIKLVTEEQRNAFVWPQSLEMWQQINSQDGLSYSLKRQENQGEYPVLYSLTVAGNENNITWTINMIKNQDHYEIVEIR